MINKFFEKADKKSRKLKIKKTFNQENKMSSTKTNSITITVKGNKGISKRTGQAKGGKVVRGNTIIVKSNFKTAAKAGHAKKDKNGNFIKDKNGKVERYTRAEAKASQKAAGGHAAASLNYMENHGAKDLENSNDLESALYNEEGERLTREQVNELTNNLKEEGVEAFRRTVIDPGQQDNISREEMVTLVKESMNEYMAQTGKNFDFKIAVHTDKLEHGGNIHAHVLSTGSGKDINMNKTQLNTFKNIVADKTEQLLAAKDLEKEDSLDKTVDKYLSEEKNMNQERSLGKNEEKSINLENVNDNSNSSEKSLNNDTHKDSFDIMRRDEQNELGSKGVLDNKYENDKDLVNTKDRENEFSLGELDKKENSHSRDHEQSQSQSNSLSK